MKARVCLWLLLGVGAGAVAPGIAAADDGWMQPGVRVWYLGAVDGGGVTSSNAEEAFLFDSVVGTDAQVFHHSALTHWTSPRAAENKVYSLLDMGPCWIHPARLQTLKAGDHWMGQAITLVVRSTTYAGLQFQFLPAKALLGLNPNRGMVKISYMIPGFSVGNAYFDAETGILLYYHALWGASKMFFALAEINYDFARGTAFAEDGGPHTGFRSFVSEQSLGSSWGVGGGSVIIQSLVESRYGATIEMRVLTSITAPGYPAGNGQLTMADENYCFFGDVPIVRRLDATQAPNYPPEAWNPFGQYLWWWVPQIGTGTPSINVFDVSMTRAAGDALTFTAATQPSRFHFSALWFDAAGYMTAFSAKDPTSGLDLKPTDQYFQNLNAVDGLGYYRATMVPRVTVHPRADFTGDLKSDILWRHATRGEVWLWPMNGVTRIAETHAGTVGDPGFEIRGLGDQTGDGKADVLWRHKTAGLVYLWPMNGGTPLAETYVTTVDPVYDIVGTGDYNGDGRSDILWRQVTNGELWVWLMNGATPVSATYVTTVDPGYAVVGSGDLNGDGNADIVWRHKTGGDVWVWLMDGATPTAMTYVTTVGELGYQIVGVADRTGDGKADILWHHGTRGEVWLWPMNGATLVNQSYVGTVPDTGYRIVGDGDYNGDGKADILWHHATRGEVWVWPMNGATRLSETKVATVPDAGYQVVK